MLSTVERAEKSCEEMREDQQRMLKARERYREGGAVINADRRQRGLSYFNTPAPHFVSPADLAVQPKKSHNLARGSSAFKKTKT